VSVVTALAAMALGRALRDAGLPVTPDRSATFVANAGLLGARDRDALYWAARFAFVTGRDQVAAFDAVFAALVDGIADPADERGDPTAPAPVQAKAERPGASVAPSPQSAVRPGEADQAGNAAVGLSASSEERLTHTRLDELDPHEFAIVSRLIEQLTLATPTRRARRSRPSPRGDHLDVRATLRRSRRTAGDPVTQLHRRRREHPRRLVALLDVSGSMSGYARAYLLLLEGAARGAHAETFVFATRLTRVTKPLREGRAHAALERASAAAPDWAGGTRLGEALRTFNDRYGRRGLARDAVVVVLSDGWERADPALVGREMQRLARLAYRIVWVNPRVAAPGFVPATGGMAAALPHTDELVSGHSAEALDAVVDAIRRRR
jgi:uncharacterized protein